jgi:hypothetical protein
MIIKNINDPATKFVTKLMACKLLRKCRKEEAPAGVVATAAQVCKRNSSKLGHIFSIYS